GVGPTIGSRREADAWLALATAHRDRLEGRDDPAAWDGLAAAWAMLGNPYEVAKARWRQAEAILASGEGRAGRGRARPALEEAAEIGVSLSARPLLREIRQLAGRAMIRLPASVDELLDTPDRHGLAGVTATAGAGDESAERDGAMVAVGPGADDQTALTGAGMTTPGNGHGSGSALARGVIGEVVVAKQDTFGLSRRERE